MHMHDGTTDFLKIVSVLGFIVLAVWWLNGAIGSDYTVLVIFALVGVLLFAGGALFTHMNQKMTLDAFNKANANDAQIDRYRMQSFKALAGGEAAWQKAAAQINVLDAKRTHQLAQQQAKLLVDTERERWQMQQQQQPQEDAWATWEEDDQSFGGWQ